MSPAYTAAQYLVGAENLPRGQFRDHDVRQPEAARSPEEAVERFAGHAGSIDADGVIDDLGTTRWSVLAAYRQAIRSRVDEWIGVELDGPPSVRFDDWNLAVSKLPGGMRKVVVRAVTITARWTDDDDGPRERRIDFDGRCFNYRDDDGEPERACFTPFADRVGLDEIFFVTVPDGGGWRVSPLDTVGRYAHDLLDEAPDDLVMGAFGLPPEGEPARTVRAGAGEQVVRMDTGDDGMAIVDVEATPGSVLELGWVGDFTPKRFDSKGSPIGPLVPSDGRVRVFLRDDSRFLGIVERPESVSDEELEITMQEFTAAELKVGGTANEEVASWDIGGENRSADNTAYFVVTIPTDMQVAGSASATLDQEATDSMMAYDEDNRYDLQLSMYDRYGQGQFQLHDCFYSVGDLADDDPLRISGKCKLESGTYVIEAFGSTFSGDTKRATLDIRLERGG